MEEYNLHDFLPLYNPISSSKFNKDINNLKEFRRYKLDREEIFPQNPGDLMTHQKMIATFMSPRSQYDSLLLVHEMGTGKTCTAVSVAEEFIKYQLRSEYEGNAVTSIGKIIILTKGEGLQDNFINEIANVCTSNKYVDGAERYIKQNKFKKIKKNVKSKYSFNTFEVFTKNLRKLQNKEKSTLYENTLFIIDEAHNLRKSDEETAYMEIYNLFQLLKTRKVLLLTGTPMKDQPEEIIDLLNLIIKKDKLSYSDLKNLKTFKKKIRGHVSYLRAMMSDVSYINQGQLIAPLKHLKVYPVAMDKFQERHYMKAKNLDETEKSIFSQSRQASLLVFPDGTYGSLGFQNNIREISTGYFKFASPTVAETLYNNLHQYSAKYADLINKLDQNYNDLKSSFVFSEFVKGSGLITLSLLLDLNGFQRARPDVDYKTKEKRYIILTQTTTSDAQKRSLIKTFNHSRNMHGEYISVILGSRVVMEGFSFKNIQAEYILTPHWNYSETSQIIARGLRVGSHSDLLNKNIIPEVKIYHYISISDRIKDSIDFHMYEISEPKDEAIQKVMRALKEASFDCELNKDRNLVANNMLNKTRSCEYQECNYTCDNNTIGDIDHRNYKLLYFTTSKSFYSLRQWLLTNVSKGPLTLKFIIDQTKHTTFEIFLVVKDIIESGQVLFSRPEGNYYLNQKNNVFFPSISYLDSDPMLDQFYYKNTVVFNGKSIDQMLYENQENYMVNVVRQIFTKQSLTELQQEVVKLPLFLQEKLLLSCITVKDRKLDPDVQFKRDMILNNYRLYYKIHNNKAFAWLDANAYKCSDDLKKWRICTEQEREEVVNMKNYTTTSKNPYGYIGLLNRTSNDFCLKRVPQSGEPVDDKRMKSVGKRCKNYHKIELVDILNRVELNPPLEFDFDEGDKQTMKKALKDIVKDGGRLKDYKRVAFWDGQGIPVLCENIFKVFMDKQLVVDDPTCGTAKKVR